MNKPLFQQIWHGDSAELCAKFTAGRVDCIITDPPFGVDNKSNMATTEAGRAYSRKIANDESPEVAIKTFKTVMSVLTPKTASECDLYIFTSYQVLKEWLVMCDDFFAPFGFTRKAVLLWKKEGPGMGDLNCPWGMGSEFILFFQKGPRERTAERRNNVIEIAQLRPNELIHPHEKPLPLLELLIRFSTKPNDFIVDPFGGSGSLARAARACGRSAVCIELDEENYKLADKKLNQGDAVLF